MAFIYTFWPRKVVHCDALFMSSLNTYKVDAWLHTCLHMWCNNTIIKHSLVLTFFSFFKELKKNAVNSLLVKKAYSECEYKETFFCFLCDTCIRHNTIAITLFFSFTDFCTTHAKRARTLQHSIVTYCTARLFAQFNYYCYSVSLRWVLLIVYLFVCFL